MRSAVVDPRARLFPMNRLTLQCMSLVLEGIGLVHHGSLRRDLKMKTGDAGR